MRTRNIKLRVVNLGPIEYGLTKLDLTPIGGGKAGILLRSTPGNFAGSMILNKKHKKKKARKTLNWLLSEFGAIILLGMIKMKYTYIRII